VAGVTNLKQPPTQSLYSVEVKKTWERFPQSSLVDNTRDFINKANLQLDD
jgi:hypothetical protein